MSKFKVGDRVRGIGGCREGELARVTGVDDNGVSFVTDDGYGCWEYDSSFKLVTPTLDNLSVDDVVVDKSREFTVGAVIGRVVVLEDSDGHAIYSRNGIKDFDSVFTVKQLKDMGFTVKSAEPAVTEVTLDQVAEKFGVPVEQLKVKK